MGTAWSFVSYDKIAERLDGLGLDAHRALEREPWVVTEKIHGANFALLTDGQEVRAAKRKELLRPGEDFFHHESLLPRLAPAVLRLHRLLHQDPGVPPQLTVYGELFGGAYPHPQVPPVPGVRPVQTGVYYAPGIEFCAFDLAVSGDGEHRFLDYDRALQLCEQAGLRAARPLAIGRYEELSQFPLGFDSGVPAQLGLPPLPVPNRAEGVVLKPVRALYVPTRRGPLRPIVKRKIAEFAEDRRYHQAERWPEGPPRAEPAWLAECARLLVSEARLANVISKEGRPGHDDATRARLCALLCEDALAQLQEDHGPTIAQLSPAAWEAVRDAAAREAAELVPLYLAVYHA